LVLGELLPRVRPFGITQTRFAVDAVDLTQAPCERALLAVLNFGAIQFGAKMYQIMRNLRIDEVRSRRSHLFNRIAAAQAVIGGHEDALVERCRKLAADQRVALILICGDGTSYSETAAISSIPIGTMTSRVARACRALHERLVLLPPSVTFARLRRYRCALVSEYKEKNLGA
jgi:RNA polymerase sigma-70 factor, ECF subfamily